MSQALDTSARVLALVDQGASARAVAEAEDALPAAQGAARAALCIALSAAAVSTGDHKRALQAASQAREAYRALGDAPGQCDALVRLASALRAAGDHGSAIASLEEAETLARAAGDERRRALVMRHIGVCCSLVGRHQHALSSLQEALALHERMGDEGERLTSRLSLLNAGNRQADEWPEGSPERRDALARLRPAWAALAQQAEAAGQRRLALMARGNLAITLRQSGHHARAATELAGLLPQYEQAALMANVATCLVELGRAHEAMAQPEAARGHYQQAMQLLRQQDGSLDDLQQAGDGLSRVEEALGHHRAALAHLREVREIERRKTDHEARRLSARRELRIELARLASQWHAQALSDPLTGLGNRRALQRWLAEHWPRVDQGRPLALLLLDLDHFKRINDRWGHATGDEVLAGTAQVIAEHAREGDLAVRYGGEEFLLGLANTLPGAALQVAQRVQQAVQRHTWPPPHGSLAVTVSIGLANADEVAGTDELLTLADRRLYAAKHAGRNRVVASD